MALFLDRHKAPGATAADIAAAHELDSVIERIRDVADLILVLNGKKMRRCSA